MIKRYFIFILPMFIFYSCGRNASAESTNKIKADSVKTKRDSINRESVTKEIGPDPIEL